MTKENTPYYEDQKAFKRMDYKERALAILDIVVAEWESDPSSVQCFDLRIVEEAKQIMKWLNQNPDPLGHFK